VGREWVLGPAVLAGGVSDMLPQLPGPFAIMLDDWIDAYPQYWPVTAFAPTFNDALLIQSFSRNPQLVPKDGIY
jgi:hypothetical protein